ncbi:MAG TPA: M20/M25/M40 family metallo-hydrolase [Chitinispirillaceae bacterium]|nr:M20/M25/M40 family metallo-hydrolase [Chitinispirillaceae bacterium]
MKNPLLDLTSQILSLPTAPYKENSVRDFILDFCSQRKIGLRQDEFGNLIVFAKKKYPTGSLAFVAHMDHPGFIVEKNASKGSASALFYGKYEHQQFKASPVSIFTNQGPIDAQVTDWNPAPKEKAIRANLKVSGDVSQGDIGMWNIDPLKEENGLIYSRACDDLIGCALILNLIDSFAKKSQPLSFYAIFTVAEESGHNGAKYVCSSEILPKKVIPISVETSRVLPVAPIEDGVVIRVGDSQTIFSPEITQFIVETSQQIQSKDKEFKFQRKLMDGGACEGSVFFNFNYRTGAISIPLGNYHNQNYESGKTDAEYVSVYDMECASKLMSKLVENTPKASAIVKRPIPRFKEEKASLGQKFLV